MRKYILLYGTIVGLGLAGSLAIMVTLTPESSAHQSMAMVWGYLTMLLPIAFVYVGVRAYRQRELGGSITFGRAFLCGLYISLVASLFYVGTWEIYFHTFASDFMDKYTACQIEELKLDGVSGDSLAIATTELNEAANEYKSNTLYRMAFTFIEVLPLGILASLVSAFILRKRRDKGTQPT